MTHHAHHKVFALTLESGRITLRLKALPCVNLPQKSIETPKAPERRRLIRENDIPMKTDALVYRNFKKICFKVWNLKLLAEWESSITDLICL